MGDVDARREADAINALRHEFGPEGCGGWLSTLVWNVRNRYSAFPQNPIEAESVRLLVVGFLAEVAALVAERDEARAEVERLRGDASPDFDARGEALADRLRALAPPAAGTDGGA